MRFGLLGFALFLFILAPIVSVHAAKDPTMVLYLNLDENAGKVARDLSDFNNDADLMGKAQWAPGKFGSCIEFGPNNYLKVKDSKSLDITSGLTIELWAKLTKLTGAQQSGVEKGSGWLVGEYNLCPEYNGGMLLQLFDLPDTCDDEGQGGKAADWGDGNWHFFAGTWDGDSIKVYVDGKELNSTNCKGTVTPNNDPLFIGCRNGAERWVNGFMDEIKIYNRALSAAELDADMADPTANLAVTVFGKSTATWAMIKSSY